MRHGKRSIRKLKEWFGQWMNIGWDLDQCSGMSGRNKDSNQLLLLNGVSNGDGFMAKVHPESGETKAWILPKVNIELFNRVLVDFAQHFGVGKNKRILYAFIELVGRPSEQVQVPLSIHLLFLPADSPQLQRA
jgi:hypothetical protein